MNNEEQDGVGPTTQNDPERIKREIFESEQFQILTFRIGDLENAVRELKRRIG